MTSEKDSKQSSNERDRPVSQSRSAGWGVVVIVHNDENRRLLSICIQDILNAKSQKLDAVVGWNQDDLFHLNSALILFRS